MSSVDFRFLLQGFDTIECAYYLAPSNSGFLIDFIDLAAQRDDLKNSKSRRPKKIQLGSEEFLLASHGTDSGYPFLIENDVFSIQFGEFNKPNFFVKYRSVALWHHGAFSLHNRFIAWAASVGLQPYNIESLSRVDFAFDYHLPVINFDTDNFVSTAKKDNQYRKNRTVQTYRFGSDQIMLRVYNKCDEINEKSQKTWLYDLWGMNEDVWRIEWQTRKNAMRLVGIQSMADLEDGQADLINMLVTKHTTLRQKSADSNRSRWLIHPLWQDLMSQVDLMKGLGVTRSLNAQALLEERQERIGISVYGYLKMLGATECIKKNFDTIELEKVFDRLKHLIHRAHDPLSWQNDVNRRVDKLKLGEW